LDDDTRRKCLLFLDYLEDLIVEAVEEGCLVVADSLEDVKDHFIEEILND